MGSACLLELQCVDCGKLSTKWISKSVNCGHCPSHCHPAFQQGFYSSSWHDVGVGTSGRNCSGGLCNKGGHCQSGESNMEDICQREGRELKLWSAKSSRRGESVKARCMVLDSFKTIHLQYLAWICPLKDCEGITEMKYKQQCGCKLLNWVYSLSKLCVFLKPNFSKLSFFSHVRVCLLCCVSYREAISMEMCM